MPFVIDASVTAAWILPDEQNVFAQRRQTALADDHALVPAIWWFEIRNLLIVSERRGRLTEPASRQALDLLGRYPIAMDTSPVDATVMLLARKYRLTVYDAAYLELAARAGLPLATLDKRLRQAAVDEALAVIEDDN